MSADVGRQGGETLDTQGFLAGIHNHGTRPINHSTNFRFRAEDVIIRLHAPSRSRLLPLPPPLPPNLEPPSVLFARIDNMNVVTVLSNCSVAKTAHDVT